MYIIQQMVLTLTLSLLVPASHRLLQRCSDISFLLHPLASVLQLQLDKSMIDSDRANNLAHWFLTDRTVLFLSNCHMNTSTDTLGRYLTQSSPLSQRDRKAAHLSSFFNCTNPLADMFRLLFKIIVDLWVFNLMHVYRLRGHWATRSGSLMLKRRTLTNWHWG